MSSSILKRSATLILAGALVLTGCKGDTGPAGPPGTSVPVVPGGGLQVAIVSATAPASGPATVTFTVKDAAGTPIDFLAELANGNFGATRGPRFSIAQASVAGGTYDQALYETAYGRRAERQADPPDLGAGQHLAHRCRRALHAERRRVLHLHLPDRSARAPDARRRLPDRAGAVRADPGRHPGGPDVRAASSIPPAPRSSSSRPAARSPRARSCPTRRATSATST